MDIWAMFSCLPAGANKKKEEKKERMDEATSNYMRLTDCAGWCWRES